MPLLSLLTYVLVQLAWFGWVALRRTRLFRWTLSRAFVRIRRLARACRVGAN